MMENLPEYHINQPYISKEKETHPAKIGGSLFLSVERFEFAQRVAKMLATSTMIPEHFRNNIGNCLIALNLADRFMADPFMVMQNIYVVHGRPGLEGKLVIALVNQCGKFTSLQYKFDRDNSGKAKACTAYATHKETREVLEQTVTWAMVQAEGWDKKPGSKWLTVPDLMFQYRSATFFARVYCPEVILGMQTIEEILDFVDMKKSSNGAYKVSKSEPEEPLDTSGFDKMVAEIIDYPPDKNLDKFIGLTAQAQGISTDQLKVDASMEFEEFWNAFKKWRTKAPGQSKEPESPDTMPRGEIASDLQPEEASEPSQAEVETQDQKQEGTVPMPKPPGSKSGANIHKEYKILMTCVKDPYWRKYYLEWVEARGVPGPSDYANVVKFISAKIDGDANLAETDD